MSLNDLEEAIIKGIINGYRENIVFRVSYNNFESKIIEYLLTVNVAQSLNAWNKEFTYQINLEYPAIKFIRNAFISSRDERDQSLSGIDALFEEYTTIRRSAHMPFRSAEGRIDIAITKEISEGVFSQAGIEIKGINQHYSGILDDIFRLVHAMDAKDSVGKNSIEACYAVFLLRLDRDEDIVSQNDLTKLTDKSIKKWKDQIAKVPISDELVLDLEAFIIESSSLEEVHVDPEWDDAYEIARQTGAVIGMLVKIKRK